MKVKELLKAVKRLRECHQEGFMTEEAVRERLNELQKLKEQTNAA